MTRRSFYVPSLVLAMAAQSPAFAQDAAPPAPPVAGGVAIGGSTESAPAGMTTAPVAAAPAETTTTVPVPVVRSEVVIAPRAPAEVAPPDEPWFLRHRPLANAFELGIYAGAITPSRAIDLNDRARIDASPSDGRYHERLNPGASVGGRLAYYPASWLGAEAEGDISATKTHADKRSAQIWNVRGHLVFQLPLARLVPFVLVGVGGTGVLSPVLGKDVDFGVHFGGGVKLALSECVSVRLDARDTMLPRYDSDKRNTHNGQYLFGLSYTIGRTPYAPYVPPADRDGDGVIDKRDACPDVAGSLPDGCSPPPDSDGDGIPDLHDACVAVPEDGAQPLPADGCPNLDLDADGIPVPTDVCPNEPGIAPDGCAPKDSDGDGLLDPADKCPAAAETVNGFEDADGCPDELPQAVAKFSGVIKGIKFDNGKATVSKSSTALLDEAAGVLAQYPDLRVRITGHTDDRGQREFNVKLSQDRADSVKAYLVGKGVDAGRVEAQGMGPDQPIADNKRSAGRAENRRIEFSLVK